jgi:hypothetical protein
MDKSGEGLRTSLAADLHASVTQTVEKQMQQQSNALSAIIRDAVGMCNKNHEALSQEVAQHGARLDDAEHRNELLRAEMAELRKQMSVVEKTEYTQRDARDEGWERDSDLRLVIAGTQNAVTRAAIQDVILEHAEIADIAPACINVQGARAGLGKRFMVSFNADNPSDALAANRAKKFMQLLKINNDQYREYNVKAPNGDSQKVYFGKDESPQQQFIKRVGKKLRATISERLPGRDVHFVPSTGIVSVDWLPVCRVLAPRVNEPQVRWHERVEATTGLAEAAREEIKARWTHVIGTPTAEQFCL